MTPEQAKVILDFACHDATVEAATTSKVLAAMPAGKDDFKPSEKSMTAMDLAWHLASADVWFMDSIAKGVFAWVDTPRPAELQTGADIAAWYDTNFKAKVAEVSALSAEKAAAVIGFMGAFEAPAAAFVNMCLKHSIHHRGQLSTYLRPMGGKVPSIYGGSADEPFKG